MTSNDTGAQQLTKLPTSKRAAIFTRTRSLPHDAELDNAQLAAQESACQEVAQRLGAEVVSEYRAIGGTAERGVRQIVEKLLREVDGGRIDYLIIQGWDRLARRPVDLARIARRLAAAGAAIRTTAGPEASFLEAVSLFCLVAASDNKRRTS